MSPLFSHKWILIIFKDQSGKKLSYPTDGVHETAAGDFPWVLRGFTMDIGALDGACERGNQGVAGWFWWWKRSSLSLIILHLVPVTNFGSEK